MKSVCISKHVDSDTLLKCPEKILQLFSFEILKKRDLILNEKCGKLVFYKKNGMKMSGILHNYDNDICTVGESRKKISIRHIIFS